ncbi:MAG: hypothetical protein M3N13_08065, partial [Candidatus Eremiobacteraeota bacterium]|nr:hypothetical protein [Candidatus Eremiobacteraeota bacterium]
EPRPNPARGNSSTLGRFGAPRGFPAPANKRWWLGLSSAAYRLLGRAKGVHLAAAPWLLTIFVVAGLLSATAKPARASGEVLDSVSHSVHDGEETVVLRCLTRCPVYQVSYGPDNITLVFPSASLSRPYSREVRFNGLVREIDTIVTPPGLAVVLHTAHARLAGADTAGMQIRIRVAASSPLDSTRPDSRPQQFSNTVITKRDHVFVRVRLKYADVGEVVGILTGANAPSTVRYGDVSTGFALQPMSSGGINQAPQATDAQAAAQDVLGVRVTDNVAYDKRLNALLISGTQEEVDTLRRQIAEIDVPLPSALLEAEIVELTESAARDIGIDLRNAAGQTATVTSVARTQGLPDTQLNLQAQIYAAISSGKGRIVAKPRILALDGNSASILTGDAIPVLTSIAVYGSNVVQQQVQYVNVGVSLHIVPRIADDGYITSHVAAEVSSVTNFIQGVPQISQRRAVTSATVRDGQPFVIGGLLQESEIKSTARPPLLGNLPILKQLFTVHHDSAQKTNLYIIITPHIIRPGL